MRRCPCVCPLTLLLALLAGAALAGPAKPGPGWKLYKGAWFDVYYPSVFKVVPREPGAANRPDGASFLSPDGKVEFYVFSPQWSGNPTWHQKRPGEKCVSYRQQKKGTRTVTWVTYRAGDGSYERALEDLADATLNCRRIVAFRYRNQSAYRAYRPQYLKFKASLVQYAD